MVKKKRVRGYTRKDGVHVSEHTRTVIPGKHEERAHDLAKKLPSPTEDSDAREHLAFLVGELPSCTFYDEKDNILAHEQAIYAAEDGEPVTIEKSLGDGLSGEANMAYITQECGGAVPKDWEWWHADNTLRADVAALREKDSQRILSSLRKLEETQVLDTELMRKTAHARIGSQINEMEEEVVSDLMWDYVDRYLQEYEDDPCYDGAPTEEYEDTVRRRIGTVREHMARNYGRYCFMDDIDLTVSDVKEAYRSLYGSS